MSLIIPTLRAPKINAATFAGLVRVALLVMMLLLISSRLFAQQDPLYAQYFNNPMLINPAFAGSMERMYAGLSYRTQWAGIDGAPTTFNFNSHMSMLDNKVGVGVVVVQDKLGEFRTQQYKGVAAYRIRLENSTFSFGMQFGFNRYTTNMNEVRALNPDPLFAPISLTSFNTGAGVLLKSDKYIIGLSVPQLIANSSKEGDAQVQLNSQNYYLFGNYRFRISEKMEFTPSTLLRITKGSKLSTDLNANFTLSRMYTAGVFTRNLNTFGLLLQLVSKNLRVGYMFELPAKNSSLNFNSHEISLAVSLNVLKEHDSAEIGF